MVANKAEYFKYHGCVTEVWWKQTMDFVTMSLANVIVMQDQVLEEETRRDSIAKKTTPQAKQNLKFWK